MCVLAHPDGESLGTGGILAKYADEGVESCLVATTRGEEAGLVTKASIRAWKRWARYASSSGIGSRHWRCPEVEFRKAGHLLIERIAEFLCTLPSCPVAPNAPAGSLREAFGTGSMPRQGAERLPP